MGYRIRRVDVNQPAIVARFRFWGCSVAILSQVGNGLPDILTSLQWANLPPWSALIEIKDGEKCPSAQKLTKDEQIFHNNWQGEIYIIGSLDEVDQLVASVKAR